MQRRECSSGRQAGVVVYFCDRRFRDTGCGHGYVELDADVEGESETQTGKKLKCLRTDNGGKYTGKQFEDFLKASGLRHETSMPHNPGRNGSAERMSRAIQDRARSLMYDGKLDKRFWAEATSTAVHLINR